MRQRPRHVLSGIALALAVFAAALFGALHLDGRSAADALRTVASTSAQRAPSVAFTAERGTRTDHPAVASHAVHAQPASRQLRLALGMLVTGLLFLAGPRRRSRVGGIASSVSSWCSGFRPGRSPPAIRIA
jgi:hypothetical protein